MSTAADEVVERAAYLAVLVESRARLHNRWGDSLRGEAAAAEHLARQLDNSWGDFAEIWLAEPNQALDEDRAALQKAAEVLRAYAEALRRHA
jgi:exonuclease VII large subunit